LVRALRRPPDQVLPAYYHSPFRFFYRSLRTVAVDLGLELLEAVKRGDADRVRELLNRGADPNFRGRTRLDPAALSGGEGALAHRRALARQGRRPQRSELRGRTPLHCAVRAWGKLKAVLLGVTL
jgi:ankyrin repeat protein